MTQRIVHVVGDIEASGQVPGLYDAISFGLIVLEPGLDRSFYCEMAPIHDSYQEAAYKSIGVTREQHCAMPAAHIGVTDMLLWIKSLNADRLIFWSDNNGFDFAFINWYTWWLIGEHVGELPHRDQRETARDILGLAPPRLESPFGHTSRRINDLYAGLSGNIKNTSGWKKHRQTAHTHRADEDARGNAEALLYLIEKHGLHTLW